MLLAILVVISTSKGDIKVDLNQKKAPATVANFLKYVNEKHYDGTVFHRVIKRFMIQGGGLDQQLRDKGAARPPVKNEHSNGLKNVTGTIAMARTNDPDSATCQFFINTHDNKFLDQGPGYAVFGKVVKGMDVVRKIESVKTETKPSGDGTVLKDVPAQTVVIKSIRVGK
ncbi:MAG: peptidylprolyl isomerase [Myxococcales bacterium]|nr:peptidylprolyl isomerase [Myxococcales bacterium]